MKKSPFLKVLPLAEVISPETTVMMEKRSFLFWTFSPA